MKISPFSLFRSFLPGIILLLALIAGQGQAQTGIIQADQFQLSYIMKGEGPSALIIGSAKYYSRAFSQNLRKHLKLVFLDHRGFVPSPTKFDTTDFSLDKILGDIERTRQKLDLGKIIIIGHSGHSYMALEYAKKYPKYVSHVVMIGIAPDLGKANENLIAQSWQESVDPERKKILEENIRSFPDEKLARLSPSQAFIQAYVRDGPKAWYDPSFDSSPLWEGVEVNVEMFSYMWGRVFRDIDITKGLQDFNKPVFLALGRYDYLVAPPSSWDAIRPKFHHLSIRVFEKSGHTPQLEEAALFDRELLKFLELEDDD